MIIKGLYRKPLEALVLFFILFFPRNTASFSYFSYVEEISASIFWRIPALILILLLAEKKPCINPKKIFMVLAAALPALIATGYLAALAAAKTGFSQSVKIPQPAGLPGWIGAILLSLSTGALEEAYFRLYLPERILELFPDHNAESGILKKEGQTRVSRSVAAAFVISGLLFALCHAYEGLWGAVNALLASLVLSLAYIKSSSFFGIALAHGLYNVFVFFTVTL